MPSHRKMLPTAIRRIRRPAAGMLSASLRIDRGGGPGDWVEVSDAAISSLWRVLSGVLMVSQICPFANRTERVVSYASVTGIVRLPAPACGGGRVERTR